MWPPEQTRQEKRSSLAFQHTVIFHPLHHPVLTFLLLTTKSLFLFYLIGFLFGVLFWGFCGVFVLQIYSSYRFLVLHCTSPVPAPPQAVALPSFCCCLLWGHTWQCEYSQICAQTSGPDVCQGRNPGLLRAKPVTLC